MGRSAPSARARSVSCSNRYAARSGPAWSITWSSDSTHSAVSCGFRSTTLSLRFWCMDTYIIVNLAPSLLCGQDGILRRVGNPPVAPVASGKLQRVAAILRGVASGLTIRRRLPICPTANPLQYVHGQSGACARFLRTIRQDTAAAVEEFPAGDLDYGPRPS